MKRTVMDLVNELMHRLESSKSVQVTLERNAALILLKELVQRGVKISTDHLNEIEDKVLRDNLKAIVRMAAAGAVLGGVIGALGGPTSLVVGAAIGGVVGAACATAVVIVHERDHRVMLQLSR